MRDEPDCPRCGAPDGRINCVACAAEHEAGIERLGLRPEHVEDPAVIDTLARSLADEVDDRKWSAVGKPEKERWRVKAREFIAECRDWRP